MLKLRALGDCVIDVGGTPITPDAEVVFAALLYLASGAGRPVSRRQLARFFWPGADEQSAQHCVRQTLYRLKRLGVPVQTEAANVLIPESAVQTDYGTVLHAGAAELAHYAYTLTPQYLPAYVPGFSPEFGDWVEEQRNRVHGQLRRALLAGLETLRGEARYRESEVVARLCLELDPLNEDATLALAESTAVGGCRSEAIAILDRYATEIGPSAAEPKSAVSVMRRRIAERLRKPEYARPSDARLVGRQPELERLTALLRTAEAGRASGCLLWGEPGIGKSRLATEFMNVATLQGFRVELVRCHPIDLQRPLSAFVDLVPRLRMLPGALGCAPESLACLQRLTEHDPNAAVPSWGSQEGAMLATSIRYAILDLIDAVSSECSLVICIEDAHSLDAMSWAILAEALRRNEAKRLLIVYTSRLGPSGQRFEAATAACGALHPIRLSSLPEGSASALLDSLAEQRHRTVPEPVRSWCLRVGEGNPFFLHELLNHYLAGKQTALLPDSMQRLLEERLAGISTTGLQTLQAMAILGKNSSLERLQNVLRHEPHDLLAAFDELGSAHLIAANGSVIACKHDLINEAATRRLSDAAHMLLHRQAAIALEAEIEREQSSVMLWDCAQHWRQAGDVGRGLKLARLCGTHLVRLGLPVEAAEVFEGALEYCGSAAEQIEVLQLLRDTERMATRWDRVHAVSQRRIALIASTTDPCIKHCDDELMIIEARMRMLDRVDELLPVVMECTTDTHASSAHRLRSAVLGMIIADNGFGASIAQELMEAASKIPILTDSDLRGKLTLELVFHSCFGDLDSAVSAALRLLEFVRTMPPGSERARLMRWITVPLKRSGRFAESKAVLLEALAHATEEAMWAEVWSISLYLTTLSLDTDDLDAARKWQQDAARYAERFDDECVRLDTHLQKARIALANGEPAFAQEVIAGVSLDGFSYERGGSFLAAVMVETRRQLGILTRPDPALTHLERYFSAACTRGNADYQAGILVRGLCATDQHYRARELWERYRTEQRRERYPFPRFLADIESRLTTAPAADIDSAVPNADYKL